MMTQKEKKGVSATPETLRKRKIAMFILGGIFLLIAVVWLIYWILWRQYEEYTDDAYVNGNMVQLMPQISGTVVAINAEDTQLVTAGEIIIKLDQADYEVALQQAKANLAQTVRQVRQYFEHAAQARQRVILDKANLVKAQLDLKRRQGLMGNRAVSREEMQHYQTALDAAQANYNVSLYQLEAADVLVANTTLYHHPLVEIAKSQLKTAYLNYQRTNIAAPVTGYIAKRAIHPGQQVAPNTAMLAIIPLHDTWVDANYKESSLNNLRVGQPVTLYADAYPDITYHGKVVGLNAGTGSAFALLPAQNATGNWIKIVQRLPVRIQFDTDELQRNPLQLGLSMRVTINTHNRDGNRMPTTTNTSYNYETAIYAKQLTEVEMLINSILKANATDISLPKVAA